MRLPHVTELLASTGYEIRVIRDVSRRLAATVAPKFSIFDFVRTDEMGISTCIAALLDPQGRHGQGPAYLKLFLEVLEADEGAGWFDELSRAKVTTEGRANGRRRLDIHVELERQRAIAIENKPWANDQDLQLADYAQFMADTCAAEGWILVYLCEREPTAGSISKQQLASYVDAGRMKLVTFRMLVEWLERCAGITKPNAVRVFIEHLQQFVRKRICAEVDMSEAETIKDIALASKDSLQAALLVGKTIPALKKHLLEAGLHVPFERAMHEANLTPVWGSGMLPMKAYTGFGARFSPEAPGYLRFEFEYSGLTGLFWGIRRREKLENGQAEPKAASELRRAMTSAFGKGGSGAAWLWYSVDLRCVSPEHAASLKNWESSERPWLMIQDGSLVKNLTAHAKAVRDVLATSPAAALIGLSRPETAIGA